MRVVFLLLVLLLFPFFASAEYLGKLSANPYDPDSTSNAFGRYGFRVIRSWRGQPGRPAMISAQRLALTTALSTPAGHPVSVQAPATSRF